MGSQLALKSRIRSTESLAKIFNAQEMIASSHIAKARDVALNAKPYTDAIFDAVQALVAHTHITHPIAVKDEKKPARGCSRPHLGSVVWPARTPLRLSVKRSRCCPASMRQASSRSCSCTASRFDVLQVP